MGQKRRETWSIGDKLVFYWVMLAKEPPLDENVSYIEQPRSGIASQLSANWHSRC